MFVFFRNQWIHWRCYTEAQMKNWISTEETLSIKFTNVPISWRSCERLIRKVHVPKTETRTNDDDGPNENINRQSAEVCVRNYELEFIESETTCNDYFLTPVGSLLIIYRHRLHGHLVRCSVCLSIWLFCYWNLWFALFRLLWLWCKMITCLMRLLLATAFPLPSSPRARFSFYLEDKKDKNAIYIILSVL